MGAFRKYLVHSIFLTVILLIAGFIFSTSAKTGPGFTEIAILTFSFAVLTILCLYIYFRGIKKEPSGRTVHLLAAISVKILCEMILALVWFFIAKKTGLPSLLCFFILYLAFSLFSIFSMLNTLKNKSL